MAAPNTSVLGDFKSRVDSLVSLGRSGRWVGWDKKSELDSFP